MRKLYILLLLSAFFVTSCGATTINPKLPTNIIQVAKKFQGKKYRWGGTTPNGFDCSGYAQYVCKVNGLKIPRDSRHQSKFGKFVSSKKDLKVGDLVFFDTSRGGRGYVNHVGIYLGNDKFIHASSAKNRVIVTNLSGTFHGKRFKWGRRITQ
jgi:cell wall-associated NlpC family hydrolase